MSDLVPQGGDLQQLAERINAEHTRAEAAIREGLAHARAAGELLLRAQEQCPHGGWLPWLQQNVSFSARTAQTYMKVAQEWPELERRAKAQRVALLPLRDGLKLLASGQVRSGDAGIEEERRAVLQEMDNHPANKLLGYASQARTDGSAKTSGTDCIRTAVDTGWIATGTFLTKLLPEEQERIALLPQREVVDKTLTAETVERARRPNGGRGVEVRVSLRPGGGKILLRTEDGRYLVADVAEVSLIRQRFPGAKLYLDRNGPAVRAWEGKEVVAVLMPRELLAKSRAMTWDDLQQGLRERLADIVARAGALAGAQDDAGAPSHILKAVQVIEAMDRLLGELPGDSAGDCQTSPPAALEAGEKDRLDLEVLRALEELAAAVRKSPLKKSIGAWDAKTLLQLLRSWTDDVQRRRKGK
jgi:hypothetical protein